jgi:hypothetical protein
MEPGEESHLNYDEIKDKILAWLATSKDPIPLRPTVIADRAGLSIERKTAYMVLHDLAQNGYVTSAKNVHTGKEEGYYLPKLTGEEFIKKGGYTKLRADELENKRIEQKKSELALTISQRQVKWFYPSLFIGMIGGTLGIISACYTFYDKMNTKEKEEKIPSSTIPEVVVKKQDTIPTLKIAPRESR